MNKYVLEKKEEFTKAIDYFKKEIASLRTGSANPNILEGIMVDAYGNKTPLNGVATINVPDGQSITVAPWDKSVVKEVEKAIVNADLGVGVVNEGAHIRITIPKMTEENRIALVKKLNEKMEDTRIKVRKIRDDAKELIETAFDEKEVSEDDKFKFIKELDEEVGRNNDEIKSIRDKKERDIMTI